MAEIRQLATLPAPLRDAIMAGTTRTVCPTCGGGRSRELSLSIRPDLYIHTSRTIKLSCFRASCGWWANVVLDSSVTMPRTALKQATPYTADTSPLTTGDMDLRLSKFYGLDIEKVEAHGWVTTPDGKTLVLPVRDPYGRVRGHITRTFDKPKRVFTYKATAQPWLDWWPGDGSHPGEIVIVEDCLSACRLDGVGYCAVALLGTGINIAQAKEIAALSRGGTVWLALDRDAYVKAIKLAGRYQHIVQMLPICLDVDIKNIVRDEAITTLFEGSA